MKETIHSPSALGQFIKRVRKQRGVTQSQAGYEVKIDQSTFSSIEQGAPGTRLETLFRLLAALDLEMVIKQKEIEKKAPW